MYPFSKKINTVKILFKKIKSNPTCHEYTIKVIDFWCTMIQQDEALLQVQEE